MNIDVTDQVDCYLNDGESLPLAKCVCGHTFGDWDVIIDMERDHPSIMPCCGRKLYFQVNFKIFEVK